MKWNLTCSFHGSQDVTNSSGISFSYSDSEVPLGTICSISVSSLQSTEYAHGNGSTLKLLLTAGALII